MNIEDKLNFHFATYEDRLEAETTIGWRYYIDGFSGKFRWYVYTNNGGKTECGFATIYEAIAAANEHWEKSNERRR